MRQSKDNGEIQEEHGNANGDVGKTENSLITHLRVENGSTRRRKVALGLRYVVIHLGRDFMKVL